MTDWQFVEGSQLDKPAELDSTSSKVYVYQRRNIQRVSTDEGVFWQYEERKLTHDEYQKLRIAELELQNTNLELALTELYENLLEG